MELASRWILGLTFIYASYNKILLPADFAKIIYGYDLFPHALINLVAIILPFLELVAALALIIGVYPRSAVSIVNALLVAFIILLSVNLIRGHEFDCGCFAAKKDICDSITEWFVKEKGRLFSQIRAACDLIRDFLILIPAIIVLFFNHKTS